METLGTLKAQERTLVVDSGTNEKLKLSIRNSKEHQFLPPEGVNVYDLLRHDTLILSKEAAKALEQRCLKQASARSERATAETGTGEAS
jgi:large subunit ribosomal protein L4